MIHFCFFPCFQSQVSFSSSSFFFSLLHYCCRSANPSPFPFVSPFTSLSGPMYNNFYNLPRDPGAAPNTSRHPSVSRNHANNSDYRGQFLTNAIPPGVVDDNDVPRRGSMESFDFHVDYKNASSGSNTVKKLDTNTNVNEYELSNLRNPSNTALLNPFQPEQNQYQNQYQSQNQYQNQNQNPYNQYYPETTRENPFQSESDSPFKNPTDDSYEQQLTAEAVRRNDRARRKQLSRHSRFHYTNLPYVTIVVTLIQVVVFIVELAKLSQLTGSAFQTKPYFNPMLGPSTYLIINMGARYVPCMRPIQNITDDLTISFPCPNSTTTDTNVCSLSELCGLSGIPIKNDVYEPSQWYRIITPIFLHAGFLHIIFNLLLQCTMGGSIEKNIGYIKYFLIYFASGIGGFLLGANFTPNGIASTGASGSLFGIMATNIIMFIYCGRRNTNIYGTKHYALFICIMIAEIVVSFVLGLLPGLDNFSHIGGFAVGILMAVLLLPDPFFVYHDGIITYNSHDRTYQQFKNSWNPFHSWDDKIHSRVYIWFGVRVACLVLTIVYYATLAKNFFGTRTKSNYNNCKWCKYINCIPVHNWCDIGEVTVESSSDENSSTSSASSSATSAASSAVPLSSALSSTSQASSLPTSIENTGDLGSNKRRKRQYHSPANVFEISLPQQETYQKQIRSGASYINDQHLGLGLGFYLIMGFFTYRFFKRKNLI